MRYLIIIFTGLLLLACDDDVNSVNDAGPDVHDADVNDMIDVDADIFCPEQPECIPWVPESLIPDNYVRRFDSILDCLDTETVISRTGNGNLFPFVCLEKATDVRSIWHVYLIDLTTLDATMVSPLEDDYFYANTYGDKLYSVKGNLEPESLVLRYMDLTTKEWTTLYEVDGVYADTPLGGNGFVFFFSTEGSGTNNNGGIFLKYMDPPGELIELMPWEYTSLGVWATGDLATWVEYQGGDISNVFLRIFEPATRTLKTISMPPDVLYPLYPSISLRKVLFQATKDICGGTNHDLYLVDFDTEDVTQITFNPWWDEAHTYAFKYPLIVYNDYSVGCRGFISPGDYELSASFLVIHDLETGVRRPIPLTYEPVKTFEGVTFTDNLELVYYNSNYSGAQYYILDLKGAGILDAQGHVVPDPTYSDY